MSAHHEHTTHDAGHGHHGHHAHDDHADHGSMKTYVIGFVLAVILTVIPFWLVMGKVFSNSGTTGFVLLALAAVQVVVHMVYFLHMNARSEGGWNMLALVFTGMVVVILMSGSLWVMYHLNNNMMPGMQHETTPESLKHTENPNEMHNMRNMP
jgi:cytochrome o ubiquinol oxidase operon protein cyoD